MNVVVIMGRIAIDLILETGASGKSFCRFPVAVKRAGSEDTDFLPVVAFGKTAEFICKYFEKGQMIALNGSLQSSSYIKDGSNRTSFTILIDRAAFCGSKKG